MGKFTKNSGEKRSPGFSGKNSRVTPSVAAPGVTHPSDATDNDDKDKLKYSKSYNESPMERSLIAED